MADIKLSVSVAIVAAVIIAEVISIIWFSDIFPRHGERYFISAILADIGLAFIMQHITQSYWSVRKWEDAAMLSLWLSLLYGCLQAPHSVWGARSFSQFFFNVLHKFVVMFAMSFALHYFRNY